MDIQAILGEIEDIQNRNKLLGAAKKRMDYEFLLKVIMAGLIYHFYMSNGHKRILAETPSGCDLLLIIYLAYFLTKYQ